MGGLIYLKSKKQIDKMHETNCIVHSIINHVGLSIKPGMTTADLDKLAADKIKEHDVKSAVLGYKGYPASVCISINEEVVHGIPSPDKIINEGDIVTVDFAIYNKGLAGDSARTFFIGEVSEETKHLVNETKHALYYGISKMVEGNKLHDIGKAVQFVANKNGFGYLRQFCGHGIGSRMHEDPHVFNWVNSAEPNITLREGMVFAIEPMFTLGSDRVKILDDGWTVVTEDGKNSCHWELSVAVGKEKPRILGLGWDDRLAQEII